jgi:hypothetical protein
VAEESRLKNNPDSKPGSVSLRPPRASIPALLLHPFSGDTAMYSSFAARILVGISATAVGLFTAVRPAVSAESGEFTAVFNGRDFDGWRFVGKGGEEGKPANWTVRDGVISLSGGGSPHLSSAKQYGDFEMKFEWRALRDKYNSGFYIRSSEKLGNNQINLAKGAEGKLMYGTGKGGEAVAKLQKPSGEWNEWRVLVVGDKATLWCNGEKAWEATGLTPERGYVGFQAEGAPMEFRNIGIREITK